MHAQPNNKLPSVKRPSLWAKREMPGLTMRLPPYEQEDYTNCLFVNHCYQSFNTVGIVFGSCLADRIMATTSIP